MYSTNTLFTTYYYCNLGWFIWENIKIAVITGCVDIILQGGNVPSSNSSNHCGVTRHVYLLESFALYGPHPTQLITSYLESQLWSMKILLKTYFFHN